MTPRRVDTSARFLVPLLAAALSAGPPPGRADDVRPVTPGGKPPPPADVHPARNPNPAAAAIDQEIDRALAAAKVPVSPPADDAEFLRRACLDLAGRIPAADRAATFLESSDPDKRRKLIDELLASPNLGLHLDDLWRTVHVTTELTHKTTP